MAVAAEDLVKAVVLEMDLVPQAARNLVHLMDPAKATEVPRDTRVAVVPREDLTPRATRAVEEDPARREDPIPGDISLLREARAPNLVLDRMTAPEMEVETEGMEVLRDTTDTLEARCTTR